jgi:hypothetical protein
MLNETVRQVMHDTPEMIGLQEASIFDLKIALGWPSILNPIYKT